MSDLPPLLPESKSSITPASDHDFSPRCPFCAIAKHYGPVSPVASAASSNSQLDPERVDPPSYVLYSSEHVVAFLDIMPLTRGHVLIAPRKHRIKVGDLSPDEGAEIGRVLPVLARAVLKAVLPDIPHEEADYNVVQNNGPGAAQVVSHVHFHVVPRPPLNYRYPTTQSSGFSKGKYPPNAQPVGRQATAILFGRGMRDDLDDEDAAVLIRDMRAAVKEEWEASFRKLFAAAEGSSATRDGADAEGQGSGGDGGGGRRGAWKV